MAPEVEQELGKVAFTWRASLWRALIDAEFTMIIREALNGDALIERFIHVYAIRARLPRHFFSKMSAWPALDMLVILMKMDAGRKTSPPTFDRLLKFLKGFIATAGVDAKARTVARQYGESNLYHPKQPNVRPPLRFLRDQENSGKSLSSNFAVETPRQIHTLIISVRDMIVVLEADLDLDNATFAKDLLRRLEIEGARLWQMSDSKFQRSGVDKPHVIDGRSR